jgi:hypothetical protein
MAVALFNGQLRGFKFSYENINKNLFEPLEINNAVFLLPEDDRDKELEKFLPSSLNFKVVYEAEIIHDESNLPNPNCLTYSSHAIQNNNYQLRGSLQHYFIQLYNKKRVFEIYKTSFTPPEDDLVLMLRPDLSPHKRLDPNTLKNECINVPNCPQWYGVYDRLSIANTKNTEIYSLLYDQVKTLPPCGINNAESRLKAWLDRNNLCVNIFELGEVLRISVDGTARDS